MKHSPQSLIAKNIQPHNTRDICDTDFSSFRSFENFDKFESFERFKSCESLNTAKGKRKLIARHLSIRHFIISISAIILSIVYLPAYAASSDNAVLDENSAKNSTSIATTDKQTETTAPITDSPENIVDYASQSIDKLKREGISVSAIAEEVISPL